MAKVLTTYFGEALKERQAFKDTDNRDQIIQMYLPSDDLIDAVNLAIHLKRPLLLMGEPGCGKTRLAEAVAYELHQEKMYDHFFRWDIKSTTKAKDGIYKYDALKRLHHANLREKGKEKVAEIENYIDYGKLAQAFLQKSNNGLPNILLIDEVDKADIDFPNDLLLELENKTFAIPEFSEEKNKELQEKASNEVIIFITSNQEKELPPAFLRRCLFHFIEFPEKKLLDIVTPHVQNIKQNVTLIKKAIEIFITELRDNLGETDKKPSTSELIDWVKIIDQYASLKQREPDSKKRSNSENRLIGQLDLLEENKIPFKQILLKTLEAKLKIDTNEES